MRKKLVISLALTLTFSVLVSACAFASTLYKIRSATFKDKLRVVLDFSGSIDYQIIKKDKRNISLRLNQAEAGPNIDSFTDVNDFVVRYIKTEKDGNNLKVSIPLIEEVDSNIFHLNSPPRLVIDFERKFLDLASGGSVASGVEIFKIKQGIGKGQLTAYALKLDLNQVKLQPALASKPEKNIISSLWDFLNPWRKKEAQQNFYLNRVSSMVEKNQALAGINGTFFSWTGKPLGALIINKGLISPSIYDRTAFFIDDKNKAFIDNVYIYGNKCLPYNKNPKEIIHLVSGGPRLVKNGKNYINKYEEKFQKDVAHKRAARSAIGITKDKKVLLVVVEGRKKDQPFSLGAKLEELSQLMISLGAVSAMNLDGGSSSTLVVNDQVINSPSGGSERRVSNALLVFTRD